MPHYPSTIERTVYIYGLLDRLDNLRYIGKTHNPKKRIRGHLDDARPSKPVRPNHRIHWIRSMIAVGHRPRLVILQECIGDGCAEEQFHIRLARQDGINLVNSTDGGEGTSGLSGYKQSPEWVEKRISQLRGRKMPPEFGARISERMKGKVPPLSQLEPMWRAMRGTKHRPESVARRIAATTATRKLRDSYHNKPESIEKMLTTQLQQRMARCDPSWNPETSPQRMKVARLSAGLSLEKLSALSGVKIHFIQHAENRKYKHLYADHSRQIKAIIGDFDTPQAEMKHAG